MRIAIVGNSGSGKSTLARELAEVHSLASLDLDSIVWEQGKIAVLRSSVAAEVDLNAFCDAHERWVTEGCYGNLMRRALGRQPALLFLDPGVEACLANCRSRPREPQKYATREEQEAQLEFLLYWVEEYYSRNDTLSLADHRTLFDTYAGSKLRLTHPADRCLVEAQPLRWFGADALRLGPQFEACAVPAKAWTHAAHLVVGLWHVTRYGREEALVRLRAGIRRLNESHGGVNSETRGYHETITAAYVTLLAQFLAGRRADETLDACVTRLLEGPLAARDALMAFYSRDRLMSTEARAAWVEPDITPLHLLAVFDAPA
jgi:adenylate kinase family enzyme